MDRLIFGKYMNFVSIFKNSFFNHTVDYMIFNVI